ncbi:MAG: biopolymer transporter ExbD [Bacteroidota bacterium]
MNFKKNNRENVEVYTGSLNDIMFFLLLFFLIMSTMSSPQVIKLMLPKAQSGTAMVKKPIMISIDAEKKYYIDSKEIAFSEMESNIVAATKDREDPTVVLNIDKSLSVQDLVDVLQIGSKLKIKMVLSTKAEQQ